MQAKGRPQRAHILRAAALAALFIGSPGRAEGLAVIATALLHR